MALRLILEERGETKTFEFSDDRVTIGRTSDNGVRVKSAQSSRQHCAVLKTAEGYAVEDLKSRNGTLLNGETVKRRLLAIGDRIEIGDSIIHFQQRVEGGPSEPAKSPRKSDRARRKSDRVRRKTDRHRKAAASETPTFNLQNLVTGETITVAGFPFMIGSLDRNALVLPDAAPEHCMIVPADNGLFLVDLGSADGTTINGEPITREALQDGAVIGVGAARLKLTATGGGPDKPDKPKTSKPAKADVDEVSSLDDLDDEDDEPVKPSRAAKPKSDAAARRGSRRRRREPAAEPEPELADDGGLGAGLARIDARRFEASQPGWLVPAQGFAMVALLVAIIGGGTWIVMRLVERRAVDPSPEENLTANWSFEQPMAEGGKVPGWVIKAPDGVRVDRVKRSRFGRRALEVQVPKDATARVLSEKAIRLDVKRRPVALRARVDLEGKAIVGLAARWFDDRGGRLARSIVATTRDGGASALSGRLLPPESAATVTLEAFALGLSNSRVVFDRLEVEELDAKGSDATISADGLTVLTDTRGIARIRRSTRSAGEIMFATDISIGLLEADDFRRMPYGSQAAARLEKPATAKGRKIRTQGLLYDIRADKERRVSQTIELGRGLQVRWRFPVKQIDPGARVEVALHVPDLAALKPISLVDKAGQTSSLAKLFEKAAAGSIAVPDIRELAFGAGAEQISLRATAPVVLVARKESGGEFRLGLVFTVQPEDDGASSVGFALLPSSTVVRERIRVLFSEAARSRAAGDLGAALEAYQVLMRDYGFDQTTRERARALATELTGRARRLEGEIKQSIDDDAKLLHPVILESTEARVERLSKAFPGGAASSAAKEAVATLRARAEERKTKRLEARARELLKLGRRYQRERRLELARAAFETLVREFPKDFESVKAAQTTLRSLPEE